jgi:hypothetical protein
MKKVFGLILVCAFAVAFVACGNKAKEAAAAKAKADSTRRADSTAMVAADAAKAQAKADSTTAADAAKAKADSIEAATKKKKK